MKTRAEVVALIANQLADCDGWAEGNGRTVNGLAKGHQWHYGRQELRELLDFIFDGPPTLPEERIPNK